MPLRRIKAFVMDVDGTLTDGSIILNAQGIETKVFNVHDGFAIKHLQEAGILTAMISGRTSKSVELRAAELGLAEVHQGVAHKVQALMDLSKRHELGLFEIAYMGDDLNDLPALRQVGYAFAPADARDEVKEFAHFVTKAAGGRGAVAEAAERLLRAQGKWDQILSRYL